MNANYRNTQQGKGEISLGCLDTRICSELCHKVNLGENRGMPKKRVVASQITAKEKKASLRPTHQINGHFELISCLQKLIEGPLSPPQLMSSEYNGALIKQGIQLMVICFDSEIDSLLSNPLIVHAKVSVITCCSSQSLLRQTL